MVCNEISRRRFLHGASAAALALSMEPAEAFLRSGVVIPTTTGHKGQVNLNNAAVQIDWPYLNLAKGSIGFTPTGGTPTSDPWALLNSDGYPTAIPSGSTTWRADTKVYYVNKESFFSGSVTGNQLTVTGSVTGIPLFIGQTITQTAGGTALAAQSRITAFGTGSGGAGTYTLSQSSSSTGAISMQGFIPWVCDWVGNMSLSASISANGALVFPSSSVAIGSNRIEINASAINQGAGATFNLSLTAGSSTATLSSIVGTLFPFMRVTGPGIPPYTVLGFGSGTSWPLIFAANGFNGGNVLSYSLSNVACTGSALILGDTLDFTIQITSITSTPSNIRVYRQDQEALLNSGQISAPHLINFYKQYGRLRFMNWQTTNGSMLANWEDRTPLTHFNWQGLTNILPTKYTGRCPAVANNHYVGLNALPGNPSVWADKMTAQFSVSNCPATVNFVGTIDNGSGSAGNTLTVSSVISGTLRIGLQIRKSSNNNNPQTCTITAGSGTSWTVDGSAQLVSSTTMLAYAPITGFSNANPAVVTCANHGFSTGDIVVFPDQINGGSIYNNLTQPGGTSGTNNSESYTITVVDSNHFSLNGVDSTTWGTYTSGGVVILAPQFKTGLLPSKLIAGVGGTGNWGIAGGYDDWQMIDASTPNYITVVYDADLDVLASGYSQQFRAGISYEAAIQIANEINGPDPWICIPAFATDSFVSSLATYMKAHLNLPLRWCFELSNEVWNPGVGFWQTYYANAVGVAKWNIRDGTAIDQWYGWRFLAMVQQINSVFGTGNTQVQRIFGFRVDGAPYATQRATAPGTGVSSNPLSSANGLCFADYISLQTTNQTLPAAVDIYNYQQGILTSNSSLVTSALNGMDQAFNAFGCGPLFSPITATIDNGSGSAGNILTVTAISTAGPPAPTNPRIGPYSVISTFSGSNPAVGTYVLSQLTSTEPGGVLNKRGTYQLAGPAQLKSSTTFTCTGSGIDQCLNTFIPFFMGLASAYSVPEVCCYEGGYGDLAGFESEYTSYLGSPINLQDLHNLEIAYQASSQYATTYLNYLNAAKALGLKYSSQYCMTEIFPSTSGMYGLVYPNIFGMPAPAKTDAFDVYNAG
jgi:hypothetical protein